MKMHIKILLSLLMIFSFPIILTAEWEKGEGYEYLKDMTFRGEFKRFVKDGKYLLSIEADTLLLYETENLELSKSWTLPNLATADVSDDLKYVFYISKDSKHDSTAGIYNRFPSYYILDAGNKDILISKLNKSFLRDYELERYHGASDFSIRYFSSIDQVAIIFALAISFPPRGDLSDIYIRDAISLDSLKLVQTNSPIWHLIYTDYKETIGLKATSSSDYYYSNGEYTTERDNYWEIFDAHSGEYYLKSENHYEYTEYRDILKPKLTITGDKYVGYEGIVNHKKHYVYFKAKDLNGNKEYFKLDLKNKKIRNSTQITNNIYQFFSEDNYLFALGKDGIEIYNDSNLTLQTRLYLNEDIKWLIRANDSTLYFCVKDNKLHRITNSNFQNSLVAYINFDLEYISKAKSYVFLNGSLGKYSKVLWDFGDGITSKELNPEHIYKDTGTYRVILSISNSQITKYDTLFIKVVEPMIFSLAQTQQEGFAPYTMELNPAKSKNIITMDIDWGDGTKEKFENANQIETFTHTYQKPWDYDIKISLYDGIRTEVYELQKYVRVKLSEVDYLMQLDKIGYKYYEDANDSLISTVTALYDVKNGNKVIELVSHSKSVMIHKWLARRKLKSELIQLDKQGSIINRKEINTNYYNSTFLKQMPSGEFLNIYANTFPDTINQNLFYKTNFELLNEKAEIIKSFSYLDSTKQTIQDALVDSYANTYLYTERFLTANKREIKVLKFNKNFELQKSYKEIIEGANPYAYGLMKFRNNKLEILVNLLKDMKIKLLTLNLDLILAESFDSLKIPIQPSDGSWIEYFINDYLFDSNRFAYTSTYWNYMYPYDSRPFSYHLEYDFIENKIKTTITSNNFFTDKGDFINNQFLLSIIGSQKYCLISSNNDKDTTYIHIWDEKSKFLETKTLLGQYHLLQGARLNPDGSLTLWGANKGNYKNIFVSYIAETKPILSEYTSTPHIDYNTNSLIQNLYPNPSDNEFNLELSNLDSSTITYKIYDLMGSNLIESNISNTYSGKAYYRINTQSLAPGIYFIEIINGSKIEHKQFAIVR